MAAADSSNVANGAAAGGGKRRRKHKGRELVECLLVAGALALGIRTFGFQLFKIPTRSMEPTLIGNEDYGDRVVAMMWYKRAGLSLRLGEVQRWQVIVFDHKPDGAPKSTNYIKRVVGLPDEELHIRDGDIWVRAAGEKAAHIERKPRAVQQDLWIKLCDLDFADPRLTPYYWEPVRGGGPAVHRDGVLELDASERDAELDWRRGRAIDNRFLRPTVKHLHCAGKEPCRYNPGTGGGGAGTAGAPKFRAVFDNARPVALCPGCGAPRWGVLDDGREGVLLRATPRNAPAGDYWTEWESDPGSQVSDMRLCFEFQDLARAGRLEVTLTARSERFTLALPLGRAKAQTELGREGRAVGSGKVPLAAGAWHRLEVVNCDGEFRAELDGAEVASHRYDPPWDAGRYLSDAKISLSGGARVELDNLRLYRDIYYGATGGQQTVMTPESRKDGRTDGRAAYIRIEPKNYFFMGDNSLASQDGRSFGTKEERLIVARGLFVAWPPSRFHWLH